MKTSDSLKNIAKALLTAQRSIGSAKKDSKNPFFKSSYADLPTVMEVVKQPLNEAGIVVLQPATHREGKNFITTTLLHAESGEWIESETEVVVAKAGDPQAFGAAQTYARRFGLQAMLFVPAEDDDGNVAAGRTAPKAASKPAEAPAPSVTAATPTQAVALAAQEEIKPLPRSSFRKKTVAEAAVAVAAKAATQGLDEADWS